MLVTQSIRGSIKEILGFDFGSLPLYYYLFYLCQFWNGVNRGGGTQPWGFAMCPSPLRTSSTLPSPFSALSTLFFAHYIKEVVRD